MRHNSRLLENFESYVDRHSLFTHEDRILLTVSGGVDSMVMLSLFVSAGYEIGVAHCNFQLRGTESDEDEVMVAEMAARLGVPLYNRRFDTVGEMEKTGESMEMAARRLRYAWFNELVRENGYSVISVAHHIDDSIETFFINLLRGTGLRGLTGISRQMGKVVRPLLFATRHDILEYAVANHIPYREDSSNHSKKYLRNKIRLGLVPMIKEITPNFTTLMRGNFYRLLSAESFIETAVEKIWTSAVEQNQGIDTIHVDRIDPHYPRDFVIYEMLNFNYGFKGDVVEELCRSLEHPVSGKRFYSKDFVACIDRGNIVVGRIGEDDGCVVEVQEGAFRAYCGNSVLYFDRTDVDNIQSLNVPKDVALLDAGRLRFPLMLRRWREGDSFIPFGMEGRKKLSDYMIDCKMSVVEKSRQFVLCSGDDIVWVVGERIDDRYKITSSTDGILRITRETV